MSESNNNEEIKERKNKSVSFDLTDEYEEKLLSYAEKPDKGKFSKYVKRLISEDRLRSGAAGQESSRLQETLNVNDSNDTSVVIEDVGADNIDSKRMANSNDNTKAMKGFL